MTVLRFDNAQTQSFDMTDTVNLTIAEVLTTEPDNWRYTSEPGVTVQFLGSGFTYDGDGNVLTGTIQTARIVLPTGDVFALDLALDAATIGADPEALWDILLAGNDVINFQELGTETDSLSTIVGDGIRAATSSGKNDVTGTGGNDVFLTGTGAFRLSGDVETVSGVKFPDRDDDLFARYEGGDDVIAGSLTDKEQIISGDASFVGGNGTLIGGNDQLGVATSDTQSALIGDAEEAFGLEGGRATVIGGDDELRATGANSAADLVGDLLFASDFVTLRGGNDTILGGGGAELISGDLGTFDIGDNVKVSGGDDTISGGGGDDFIAGEAFAEPRESFELAAGAKPHRSPVTSIKGGDDVIDGGDGDDTIFGEVFFSHIPSAEKRAQQELRITGGNDTIDGGNGDDLIFGQTGKDRIDGGTGADTIDGGKGKDRIIGGLDGDLLSGGKGADLFIFNSADDSSASDADSIADFSTRQNDRIDLRLVDANANEAGIQSFDFIGKAGSGEIGELRVQRIDGNTMLLADIDGDGSDDFRIEFDGKVRFDENDFLF